MKKQTLILISVIIYCFNCSNDSSTKPNFIPEFYKSIIQSDQNDRHPCANLMYPDRLITSDSLGWTPCSGGNDTTITAYEAAYLWAAYNPYWDEDLEFQACGESIPESLPSISNLTKVNGANPYMKWDFMWAHYYVIKRKIGTGGSWSIVHTYTLPNEPMTSAPDTTWRDGSINFRTFENIVYYRVYGKFRTEESSSAPEIYWDCRPSK